MEIRPQHVREIKFRIGALPQKEIAQPHFSARSDNEVDIGKRRGVKSVYEIFFGKFGFSAFYCEVGGSDYFRPRTVIKRDVKRSLLKIFGLFDDV